MAKELTGTVVSLSNEKTALVSVVRRVRHPLYKKIVRKTKRYKAHMVNIELELGDTVVIRESRPISKDKHFIVYHVGEHKFAKDVLHKAEKY